MPLTTQQQEQADALTVSAPKYLQELRSVDSTDLLVGEKTQITTLRNLSYPLTDPASGYDDYVSEIRSPGSSGLSAGIKAQIASAKTTHAEFISSIRSGTLVFREDWSTVADWDSGTATQPPPPSSDWEAGYYGSIRMRPEDHPHMLAPGQVKGDSVKAAATINTSTNVLTSAGHGQSNGTKIWLSATTLPTSTPQVTENAFSFVIDATTDTFKLSDTLAGTAIDFTTTGTTVVWNAANPLWFRTPGSRSWISMIESFPTVSNGGYNTDVQVIKDITPTNELYCSAWIRFQPGWEVDYHYGHVKMFRATHWNGTGDRSLFFSGGNHGPIFIWDWLNNSFNSNASYAIRGAPQATNYFVTAPSAAAYHGRSFVTGDMTQNFTDGPAPLNPEWTDQLNGGPLPTTGQVSHNQVYGDGWNFMEWYLKLNSAPGVADGELAYWLRGEQHVGMGHIPWLGDDAVGDELWNSVMLGGNGRYSFLDPQWDGTGSPDQSMSRWWACSDFEIHNALPAGRAIRIDSGPNANYP